MNPIYKFQLNTDYNGVINSYAVHPLYRADVAKEYEIQQNEKFYRAKLSGKLLFSRADYKLIAYARFETRFELIISISWDCGQTWAEYWRGEFWKTDCQFDLDAMTIEVTPAPVDEYTGILSGMEKEYNLVDLKPAIEHITIAKRPLIQMYVPGESVVSCFLSGMYWEQDCNPITNETILVNTYRFALNNSQQVYDLSGAINAVMLGASSQGYRFYIYEETGPSGNYWVAELLDNNNNRWFYNSGSVQPSLPLSLDADTTTGATGTVYISTRTIKVYARYLLDVNTISGVTTYPIPANDMVENNRNYRRVVGYAVTDTVVFSSKVTNTPTPWGIVQPGLYYDTPTTLVGSKFFPIGRSQWSGYLSIWFSFFTFDWILEESGRKEYTLKDAYPLASVISVLLNEVAPGITHEPTTEYSQFLYGSHNPISGDTFKLFITQKSNVLAGDYSQPAQNIPITLKMVTDMLRDVYGAYWYIEDGKFKVEHLLWFKNGGRYTGTPAISHDLTFEKVTRNNKAWAFGTSQFEYNKTTMPERFQYGWMDEVTTPFVGNPIEVISKYVNPGNIKEIRVGNFTPDIDYMLLNPGGISKDGFALLAAVPTESGYKLPFLEYVIDNVEYHIQNGLLSFFDLQPKYHLYDMPAWRIKVNGRQRLALSISREKKQTVRFPVENDPNPAQLIKTYLGNGQVEKISVNLSSRNANCTLMFDTTNYNE